MSSILTADHTEIYVKDFFDRFFDVTAHAQPVSHEVLKWARSISMQANDHSTLAPNATQKADAKSP